jgi:hypothetical protein
MTDWIEFDFHGRATMRVDRQAPTASLMEEMFAPFLASGVGRADLTITEAMEPMAEAGYGEEIYRYSEDMVYLNGTNVQIVRDGDGFRLHGSRELLVSALPLIDRILVTRGTAWIHAATVDYRGHGVCLPAWGGVGKTSTIAKLLRIEGVAFMGDDWAFLDRGGELLGYAKPMSIKPHHRPIYPHLFKGVHKPLVPKRLSKRIGDLTTLVHPLVTQYPALARLSRRYSPEHMMVTPRQAFPHASFSTRAPLAITIFVERYGGSRTVLEERDRGWMVSRMIGNFHAEIKHHSQDVITALGATGIVPIEQAFIEKAAVIDQALAGKPTFLLQVPKALSADEASDVIVEQLQRALALAGVREQGVAADRAVGATDGAAPRALPAAMAAGAGARR